MQIPHGALVPRNILIKRVEHKLEVKISDFGLSSLLSRASQQSKIECCFPAAYTSPEIMLYLATKKHLTLPLAFEGDVYSAGVMLWRMLSKQIPYQGLSETEIWEQVSKSGCGLDVQQASSR
jgi:serine/threonine protein kinase